MNIFSFVFKKYYPIGAIKSICKHTWNIYMYIYILNDVINYSNYYHNSIYIFKFFL